MAAYDSNSFAHMDASMSVRFDPSPGTGWRGDPSSARVKGHWNLLWPGCHAEFEVETLIPASWLLSAAAGLQSAVVMGAFKGFSCAGAK